MNYSSCFTRWVLLSSGGSQCLHQHPQHLSQRRAITPPSVSLELTYEDAVNRGNLDLPTPSHCPILLLWPLFLPVPYPFQNSSVLLCKQTIGLQPSSNLSKSLQKCTKALERSITAYQVKPLPLLMTRGSLLQWTQNYPLQQRPSSTENSYHAPVLHFLYLLRVRNDGFLLREDYTLQLSLWTMEVICDPLRRHTNFQ